MNVSLGAAWEQYIADQIQAGQFNNASEVVRDALRRQQEYLLKLEALRNDIKAGVASVSAGQISRASAADIIKKAKARK
jgi:antitoxin ParD1/3/4